MELRKLERNVIIKSKPDALIVKLLLGTSVVKTKPNYPLAFKIDVETAKKEAVKNATTETLQDASTAKFLLVMSVLEDSD